MMARVGVVVAGVGVVVVGEASLLAWLAVSVGVVVVGESPVRLIWSAGVVVVADVVGGEPPVVVRLVCACSARMLVPVISMITA